MKGENGRKIVAEKQVAEIDDNISFTNYLIDQAEVNIKQAVEEKRTQKSRQLT